MPGGAHEPAERGRREGDAGGLAVHSTLALAGVVGALRGPFEAASGLVLTVAFAPTALLMERIAAGERPDLALLTAEAAAELDARGLLRGAPRPLVRSSLGIAAAPGGSAPEIGSLPALVRFLRAAPSIAYSRSGASGRFFAALLDRLALRAVVDAKAVIVPSGFTAERVVSGEAAYAVQQVSELLFVPGIGPVAPLPEEAQSRAVFAAALLPGPRAREAEALVAHLTHPDRAGVLAAWGLRPEPAG
ncbi:Aconitate isomerase [Methylobacterium crusticola]|uniref:Aconitate isomerase n=1 Tax=Methylobacterium crusticola TaxID=1697972 RepID=A0ABQ4QV34_9HYPH|nr:substrate-binding domain-containing protein [Methylobacterium crusticola]GJD48544.1 Aconitate isomerase [Methylobacterium crusticola]